MKNYKMKSLLGSMFLTGFFLTGFAQGRLSTQIGNLKKVITEGTSTVLITNEAEVRLMVYGPEIIRVRVSRVKPSADFSYAVIGTPEGQLSKISENNKEIRFSTGKINLIVNKMPVRLKFTDLSGKVISEDDPSLGISWMGTAVTNYRKLFDDERFIGLGEKTGGLNRRGSAYVN